MAYLSGGRKPAPGTRRKILERIRRQLRPDSPSELAPLVRTWQLGDGEDGDLVDETAWTVDLFPLLRLRLDGSPGAWQNQATTKFTMAAVFTIAIKGGDQADALDWWEAIERAFYPGDGVLMADLNLLGVNSYTITQAGITRAVYADGLGQVISGRLTINHEIRTKV